jgi:dTDP-4-dehydrorhamnose 3,5-epimerase
MNKPQAEVILLETRTFSDHRGYFRETYRRAHLRELIGREIDFVQDNQSWSARAGTLRGLHFQLPPRAQAKLVSVASGEMYDVVVDLRLESPNYGQWLGFVLSAENGRGLLVPEGFAHGFLTLTDNVLVSYKTSEYYAPECELGLRWDDPVLNIEWPLNSRDLVISDKDSVLPLFSELKAIDWSLK